MLTPLPYHLLTTSYFKQQSKIWNFFTDLKHKEGQLLDFKSDLLKNTYKFTEESEPSLYNKVNIAREKLGLNIPVTLYQVQHTEELNASIVYLAGAAHIVFSGNLIKMLTDEELLAIIGHELSHLLLYTQLDGDIEVADRIVTSIVNSQGSSPTHYETARLFQLYTEVFCDRGAYIVCGDYKPIIQALVKIATSLDVVNADSYIKQADEIFDLNANTKTAGVSHPENFIRARSIWLWHKQGNDGNAEIQSMIEGHISLDELDLFRQQQMNVVTLQLLQLLLKPQWIRTPQTLALFKQYFPSEEPSGHSDENQLKDLIEPLQGSVKEYLGYVLYDFATADKSLEDNPLSYCFFLSDQLQLQDSFAIALKREKKLTDKIVGLLKKRLLATLQEQKMQTA